MAKCTCGRVSLITLLVLDAIVGALALAALIVSIILLAKNGELCATCLEMPATMSWAVFGISLFIVSFSVLGFAATKLRVRPFLIIQVVFTILTFSVTVAAAAIFLVWTSGGALGPVAPTVTALELEFEDGVASWAAQPQNAQEWLAWQDSLGCCGVGIKAVYDYPTSWDTLIDTGAACNATFADVAYALDIAAVEAAFPAYNSSAQAFSNALGLSAYFCSGALLSEAGQYTGYLGGVLAALAALQALVFLLGIFVLCSVHPDDGGLAPVDEQGDTLSPVTQVRRAHHEFIDTAQRVSQRMSASIFGSSAPPPNSYGAADNPTFAGSLAGLKEQPVGEL